MASTPVTIWTWPFNRDIEPNIFFFDETSVMAHEGRSDGGAEMEHGDFDKAFFGLNSNTAKSS